MIEIASLNPTYLLKFLVESWEKLYNSLEKDVEDPHRQHVPWRDRKSEKGDH